MSYFVGTYIGKVGKDAIEKNIDYFLQCNDPTNHKKQMGGIIHALLDYATRCMISNGHSSASPIDVLNFMKHNEINNTTVMEVLNLVFCWELMLLRH